MLAAQFSCLLEPKKATPFDSNGGGGRHGPLGRWTVGAPPVTSVQKQNGFFQSSTLYGLENGACGGNLLSTGEPHNPMVVTMSFNKTFGTSEYYAS